MSIIKSSVEFQNDYTGISKLCHEYNEPVFISENDKEDLVVMSIETYKKFDLYAQLEIGLRDVQNGNTVCFEEAMERLRNKRQRTN